MFEVGTRRRFTARLGVVLVAIFAIGSLGMSLAHAAPPFTITITEPVGLTDLTVTLSGTADSPSHTDHHIVIDWGDTNTDTIQLGNGPGPWNWGPIDHTYAAGGTYTITATIIHSQDTGNDQGQSASDTTVVEIPGCPETGCPTPDPCLENPTAPECTPTDDGGEVTPPPVVTPPPAADDGSEVLGKTTTKKPLAKTANETTAILWTAILMLMVGATIRFCAPVQAGEVAVVENGADDLVTKSLELVSRLVRPRGE